MSRRTINRDIEDLCKAGIPLITLQGIGGGICIADGYKIDKTLFTSKEMQAILAGLKSLDSVSSDNQYKQVADKIYGIAEDTTNENIYDKSGHILIDLASHYKGILAPKIQLIRKAIDDLRLIEFDYYCFTGESVRVIEPYLIVFQWSNWYIWGYCRNRQEFRLFKLNRLLNLGVLNEKYEKRIVPPIETRINQMFENEIHLVAEFNASVKWRLIEEFGVDSFIELPSGKLQFEFEFANKDNLFGWILGFGDTAKIISPQSIKDELIEKIDNMKRIYLET